MGYFDPGPKHRNKPKHFLGVSGKNQKQPKQFEFQFVLVQTKKKIIFFQGHPNRVSFWEIFSVCLEKVLFVLVVPILVQNTETIRNFFWFRKTTKTD